MDCLVSFCYVHERVKNVKVCTEQRCSNMGSFSNDLDNTKSEDHGQVQIKEIEQKKKNNFFSQDENLLPGLFEGNLYLQIMLV